LEILKYLHENGCPWDDSANYAAIQYNHSEILKYLYEHGCQWMPMELDAEYDEITIRPPE